MMIVKSPSDLHGVTLLALNLLEIFKRLSNGATFCISYGLCVSFTPFPDIGKAVL